AGGEEVYGVRSVVAKGCNQLAPAFPGRGADLDPVRRLPAVEEGSGRVGVGAVEVRAVVTGRVDQQHVVRCCITDGVVHHFLHRREVLTEAHVDDVGAVVDGIADRVGDVLVALVAVRDGAEDHDLDVGGNSVDADAVVAFGGDDAGDVRTVVRLGAADVIVAVPDL